MPSIYKTVQGDTWDIISLKNYGVANLADVLIQENYIYKSIVIFSAGVSLSIPDVGIPEKATNNLPPWRR